MANPFTKTMRFLEKIWLFNLHTGTWKIALSPLGTPLAQTIDDVTQLANGNGYTTGGATIPNAKWQTSANVGKLIGDKVTFTASGGNIGPFRCFYLYESGSGYVVGFWDNLLGNTITNGETRNFRPEGVDVAGGYFSFTLSQGGGR